MSTEYKKVLLLMMAHATLEADNPTLELAQQVIVTGAPGAPGNKRKIGDGVTAYNDLDFEKAGGDGLLWTTDESYAADLLTQIDGYFYSSVQVDNAGHDPRTDDGTWWLNLGRIGGGTGSVDGIAGEAISAGEVVYFSTDGKVYLADSAYIATAIVAGVALATVTTDDTITVMKIGLIDSYSGLTVGTEYYLGADGTIVTRGTVETDEYIVHMGTATATDTLDLFIQLPEATREQDDSAPIGSITYFSTYKDRSATGYLPFAFDNAISQANYPLLYSEIGDVYEAQHVAAGDSASGTGMFYPTPVPGAYDRMGLNYDFTSTDVNAGTWAINNVPAYFSSVRSGIPVRFELVSGTKPTGFDEGTVYFLRTNVAGSVYLAGTEAGAVASSGTIDPVTAGSGTFRLTQEGIAIDDAFQGHNRNIVRGNLTTDTAITDPSQPAAVVSGAGSLGYSNGVGGITDTLKTMNYYADTKNGTPRVTSETRPVTNYSFGYIKAENVTSAGEVISALRYDTGWITPTTFSALDIDVTHNLDAYLSDLDVKLMVNLSGEDSGITVDIGSIEYDKSSSIGETYGYSVVTPAGGKNSFQVRIGVDGLKYLGSSGQLSSVSDTWYYKVVVTAPNLMNTVYDVTSSPFKSITSSNTAITTDQELIIGPDESVVSSDGREPIEGMNLGTYIPPMVSIDGKRYPNPSCINIDDIDYDDEATWSAAEGSYGFFEDWENVAWKETSDWTGTGTALNEGDWIDFTAAIDSDYIRNSEAGGATATKIISVLVKRVTGSLFKIGYSTSVGNDGTYTWDTGIGTDGLHTEFLNIVKISGSLVFLTVKVTSTSIYTLFHLSTAGDQIKFKYLQVINDISFTPPFGMDGNSKNPARAYPFDKWDQPISFKFKPQFDWDVTVDRYIISDYVATIYSVIMYYYQARFVLELNGSTYYFGYDGTNWDGGTTTSGDATQFSSSTSSFLNSDHDVTIFVDKDNNQVDVWLDSDHVTVADSITLTSWNPNNLLGIGGIPLYSSPDTYYGNSLISNFCVHPKTQSLPIDQSKPFYDPLSLYNKSMEGRIPPFGNPFKSLIASGGGIVEEGENINGSYIIFESGLKVCMQDLPITAGICNVSYGSIWYSESSNVWSFPIIFDLAMWNATSATVTGSIYVMAIGY